MNGNRSVATIDAPEFINLEPFNPLISTCEIKVLYLGKNRNGSYITKDVAIQMANSLPGCPIVGAYREDIKDFGDHGHVMRIEDGEVHFSVKTKPYGFVAPDAEVWFKDFTDTDEAGNETKRTYLMTTGYLWTGQYEEAQSVLDEGKGQSMELDEKNLHGMWAEDSNSELDFFIINDAVFSKLCILGDGVEPCFEGAAVTAPEVSKEFSADIDFHRTLFTMMKELKDALIEGGLNMPQEVEQEAVVETETVETEPIVEFDENSEGEGADVDSTEPEVAPSEIEVDEVDMGEVATIDTEDNDDDDDDDEDEESSTLTDDDEDEVRRRLLEHTAELEKELEVLRAENQELSEFKAQVERKEKQDLINKYYMLDDVDKADIVENIDSYSLAEIEAQLAIAYVAKNVDFSEDFSSKEEVKETEDDVITTFTLDDTAGIAPPMVEALRRTVHE